jgi:hypothetical protein
VPYVRAYQAPQAAQLSVDDALRLRKDLSEWKDSKAVLETEVEWVKKTLRGHPALADAAQFTLTYLPLTNSVVDRQGNFAGHIPTPDGGYIHFDGTLAGTTVTIRRGGTYDANRDPIIDDALEKLTSDSIRATLKGERATQEQLLATGANGEGGFVVLRDGKGGYRLFEGKADGNRWNENRKVQVIPERAPLERVALTFAPREDQPRGVLSPRDVLVLNVDPSDPNAEKTLVYGGEKAFSFAPSQQ